MKISYVSCTAGMLASLNTSNNEFTFVDVICGRQRQPLNEETKHLLAQYLSHGGRLLMSTDHFSQIDPKWAKQYLHASYYAAKATRSGRITTPRHRIYQLVMEPNEEQLFTCTPEALKAEGNNTVRMATYEDMRCVAGIGFPAPDKEQSSVSKTLVYSFPLEAVQDFDKIYHHSVKWLIE